MTDAPLILGLDLSKKCSGIAKGRAGQIPEFRSLKLAEYDDDAVLGKYMVDLIDELKRGKPDFVFYEAALKGGVFEAPILKDLVAVTRAVCWAKAIRARPVNVQTARQAFLGHGRPDNPKARAFAMCRMLGWDPKNHDEGDAGTIFFWGSLQAAPRFAQCVTPMQQQKVASLMNPTMPRETVRA